MSNNSLAEMRDRQGIHVIQDGMRSCAPVHAVLKSGRAATRRVTPEAGHALETLGHAIEYLIDEMNLSLFRGTAEYEIAGKAEAIKELKSANLEVYFDCPAIEPSGMRAAVEWLRYYRRFGIVGNEI
jgi:hypothetical protein